MSETRDVPAIITIFGAKGDLAARKIVPALWHLHVHERLPQKSVIIGFARRSISEKDFRDTIAALVRKSHAPREDVLQEFIALFTYIAGTFEDVRAFRTLADTIERIEKTWGICGNKLLYLAVPPSSYEPIFKNLAAVKLNLPCGGELGWSRLLIEKPFGLDGESARELQRMLSLYFTEEQIYRIDHYLFKEIVQGIENFRFSNNLFEKTWSNAMIESIDIRLRERAGVEGRGTFYDAVGALRDVGQNHLLELLAVLTADSPLGKSAEAARARRSALIDSLLPWTEESVRANSFRAQYEGYLAVEGVSSASQTETYVALKTELTKRDWCGVPVRLEAGKGLAETRKEIVLTLKHPTPCQLCDIGPHAANRIVFRLEPNEEILIHFSMKKPGFENVLEERTLSFFLYERGSRAQYVEEYAKILHEAIRGDQSLFVSSAEVDALWKFIDPVLALWHRGVVPLSRYSRGTTPKPPILATSPDTGHKRAPKHRVIGIVGLGKMGANIARQLMAKGWRVVGFNTSIEKTRSLSLEGLLGASSLQELVSTLPKPRTIWLMVPHGSVDTVLKELTSLLNAGDRVIDGGNSFYKDSMRHAQELRAREIQFLDVGVSGGPEGARSGACLMIGGDVATYETLQPLWDDVSVPHGYARVGGAGAGHFVKMVHNGIEYGMMQAIAEGFSILRKSPFSLSLQGIADLYNHGSVIESRLMGWLSEALELHGGDLSGVSPTVEHTGEGAWTVDAARELGLKARVIELALQFRVESEKNPEYAGKILSALRERFGGHAVLQKL